jgi:uncharacterized membrane protein
LKVESAIVAVLAVCIFLSFYFALLSFQALDDAIKKQLVTLAAYVLISGIVILSILIVHLGIKKAFSNIEDQLTTNEQKPNEDEA